jgi:hypothetical protein
MDTVNLAFKVPTGFGQLSVGVVRLIARPVLASHMTTEPITIPAGITIPVCMRRPAPRSSKPMT